MKKLTEQLKNALDAMAFADFGEMLSPSDKGRVLAGVPLDPALRTPPRTAPAPKPARQIVLSLGETLHTAVMDYVVGVCQRMDAELVILSSNADSAADLLATHGEQLAAAHIAARSHLLSGNTAHAVNQYLHTHPQVLFVVSGGMDDPVHQLMVAGKHGQRHAAAPVPIVVVAQDHAPAARGNAKPLPRVASHG